MNTVKKAVFITAAAGGILAAGMGAASAGAGADGAAVNSPGVASGNNIEAPIHIPINICGNSVDVVGVLNPTFGNQCYNIG
jgi:hypothetical protein